MKYNFVTALFWMDLIDKKQPLSLKNQFTGS